MISVLTGSAVLVRRPPSERGRDGARRAGVAMAGRYTDGSAGDKDLKKGSRAGFLGALMGRAKRVWVAGASVVALTGLFGLATAVALMPPVRARVELWRRGVPLGDQVAAVHAASRVDDVETLKLLRTATANLSARDRDGNSALHTAIASNAHQAAAFLLDAGVDGGGGSGETPLSLALRSGDAELAQMLLARGTDPNQADAEGVTPLARAVVEHDQRTARALLAAGASPDVDPPGPDGSVLEHAVREGWADFVTLLLARGANPATPSREGQPLLPLAVALGRADVTAALLDAGADIETPLVTPVSEDFMALVPGKYAQHYLTRDEGITPLMVAVLRGDLELARLLRERKASLGPTRGLVKYPLGMAANRRDIPMMQVLLGRDPAEAAKARHIVVSLSQQKATLYEQDKSTLETRVSTGRKGFRTPAGEYVITNKHRTWTSTIYEGAEMPYFMRLSGSDIGLHQGVVPRGAASHGCVRVPAGTARRLYERMRVGDPVTITLCGADRGVAGPGPGRRSRSSAHARGERDASPRTRRRARSLRARAAPAPPPPLHPLTAWSCSDPGGKVA